MIGKMLSRKWIILSILVLLGALVCIRLGFWQLDRLAQRRASNAHYVMMKSLDPVTLPTSDDLETMEYRSISVSGTYDFSEQVAIRNQYYDGRYGYHLLTPLVLIDGEAILVDRGWIPADGNDRPSNWARYDGSSFAEVKGIIRLSREKADLGGKSDPQLEFGQSRLDIWNFPNLSRIQKQSAYRLLPIYIQVDPVQLDTTPPIPSQPEVDLTEGPHLGYAIQWFSFSAIMLLGYPIYIRKQVDRLRNPTSESKEGKE
jgi:surfeit locus 1 family protein